MNSINIIERIKRRLFHKLLIRIPRLRILEFLGRPALSEIEKYYIDGGDEILFDIDCINESDSVIVLGGFHGISTAEWSFRFNCNVYVYEPIPEFFEILVQKFGTKKNIHLFQLAVSDEESTVSFFLNGEGTGVFPTTPGTQSIEVRSIDASHVITQPCRILEINIEGGEYRVLRSLIDSRKIQYVETLLIQFHSISFEHDEEMAKIRNELKNNFKLIFSYPYVWERWDKRPHN